MSKLRPGLPIAVSKDDVGVKKRKTFTLKNTLKCHQYVLDIGCGYGKYTDDYLKHRFCIDVNIQYLQEAQKNSLSNYLLMDAQYLGFKEDVFDIILLMEVFEHLEKNNKFLQEIYRHLTKNGRLIFTVPNKLFLFETHAIRIGNITIGTKFGLPLLPLFPDFIRKKFSSANVFDLKKIIHLLKKNGYTIIDYKFLTPSFDNYSRNCAILAKILNKISRYDGNRMSSMLFGSTIILCVEKTYSHT